MEWLTDGHLIRLMAYLVPTGVLGWLLRRAPRRLGRWFSKRIHMERENVSNLSKINSLEWELTQEKRQNNHLVAELAEVHRRVEESRKRAEHLDSLLGSEETARQTARESPTTSG